jgi:hypothetical protein
MLLHMPGNKNKNFLNRISNDGALDEGMSTFEGEIEREIFYFHGLSKDGEDSVTIHVFEAKLKRYPNC